MRPAEEPLDEAERLARELADYDDREEEITANVHVHVDSRPDSDPPVKKQIKSGLLALGSGIGIALIGGAIALLQRCK